MISLKTIKNWGLIMLILSALFVWWANNSINQKSENFHSYNLAHLPNEKTALVLGTSKTLANGQQNMYFTYRMKAAAELYKAGKVRYIIVSGDHSQPNYNEPKDMKHDLITRGIPEHVIFEDFAGLRTLDSVIRARDIFGQTSYIIVSQEFHNQRAIFLAHNNGITAYAYNAKDVSKNVGFKTNLREKLARVKVYLDLLFGTEPKYRGKAISIP